MADTGIVCIIGLGNPGSKYELTRHNAGYWFVDLVAQRHRLQFRKESKFHGETCRLGLGGADCWLLKPDTFMNRSGRAASALMSYYKIPPNRTLVVHDELDMPPGQIKLKRGGGHGGHNGLRDIVAALGSPDFWRLRVGIGHPGNKDLVVDYVLDRAQQAEQQLIDHSLDLASSKLDLLFDGQYERFMNQVHSTRA